MSVKRKHVRDRSARRRAVSMQEEAPVAVSATGRRVIDSDVLRKLVEEGVVLRKEFEASTGGGMSAPVVGRLLGDIAEARAIVDRTVSTPPRGVPAAVVRTLLVVRRLLDDVAAVVE